MAGVSLTVTWLDDELEPLWAAPAETPAYRRGITAAQAGSDLPAEASDDDSTAVPFTATASSRGYATVCVAGLEAARDLLHAEEPRLGDMDAIAGDGDHGRGMVRGVDAAVAAAADAFAQGAGAGDVLAAAGDAWADRAGGTSGVLWGAGLRALGESLGNSQTPGPADLSAAVTAFAGRITDLGKAVMGDKTMVDALLPFAETLARRTAEGADARAAWQEAAAAATSAAAATATLRPLKGRARPLAEKSLGTADPGATSLAMIFTVLGGHLAGHAASPAAPAAAGQARAEAEATV
jgi:dihydroxyacetone kinase